MSAVCLCAEMAWDAPRRSYRLPTPSSCICLTSIQGYLCDAFSQPFLPSFSPSFSPHFSLILFLGRSFAAPLLRFPHPSPARQPVRLSVLPPHPSSPPRIKLGSRVAGSGDGSERRLRS